MTLFASGGDLSGDDRAGDQSAPAGGDSAGGGDLPALLVVDDEEAVLDWVERCLAGTFKVLRARDGREGLGLALRERPGTILTDYSMPRMNGVDLCRAVRREAALSGTRVILMSGTLMPEGVDLEGAWIDGFLRKPFPIRDLLSALAAG